MVLKFARQGIPPPYTKSITKSISGQHIPNTKSISGQHIPNTKSITKSISGQHIPNTTINTLPLILDNYFPNIKITNKSIKKKKKS